MNKKLLSLVIVCSMVTGLKCSSSLDALSGHSYTALHNPFIRNIVLSRAALALGYHYRYKSINEKFKDKGFLLIVADMPDNDIKIQQKAIDNFVYKPFLTPTNIAGALSLYACHVLSGYLNDYFGNSVSDMLIK